MTSYLSKIWHDYKGWIVTHFGVPIMSLMLILDPSSWKTLTSYSGYIATAFLVGVLLLNPLKSLFPTSFLLKKLNLYRREIGVACFFYTCIHLACFLIKRGGIIKTIPFLLHPGIGPVILVAFPLLAILTYTSTNKAIKKMGFLKWKKLHKSVYIVEFLVFTHMLIFGKTLYACLFFLPLFALQILKRVKTRQKAALHVAV